MRDPFIVRFPSELSHCYSAKAFRHHIVSGWGYCSAMVGTLCSRLRRNSSLSREESMGSIDDDDDDDDCRMCMAPNQARHVSSCNYRSKKLKSGAYTTQMHCSSSQK